MTQIEPLAPPDLDMVRERWHCTPVTSAVPLLPVGASEQEWLAARRQHESKWRIGASELAAVLGISPHSSPFSLWWSKQASWVAPERTTAQDIGHRLEDVIGQIWAERHPEMMLLRPGHALYGHPSQDHDWLVCTPDFLAVRDVIDDCTHGADCEIHANLLRDIGKQHNFDDRPVLAIEPVECKSDEGGKGWGKPGTDEVPEHHKVQVYVQCEILGARRGHLMRLAGKRPAAYVLPYDDEARSKMGFWLYKGAEFVRSLVDDDPPDVDGHQATTEALQQLHSVYTEGKKADLAPLLISEFKGIEEMYAAIKNAREEIRNRVRVALRDAQIGTDETGKGVVKRNIYKRRGYEVGPSMVDELRRMS